MTSCEILKSKIKARLADKKNEEIRPSWPIFRIYLFFYKKKSRRKADIAFRNRNPPDMIVKEMIRQKKMARRIWK